LISFLFGEYDDTSIHEFAYVEVALDHTGLFEPTAEVESQILGKEGGGCTYLKVSDITERGISAQFSG